MRSRIGIGEAADLAFLGVYQPADTVLRCMAINKRPVLIRHDDTMAVSLGWVMCSGSIRVRL
ncbi:hypothetical protein [Synechococcus sp. MIT S9507]|uniref:hypothetical protein n=1 Tax=Synechococcus sp. MIT S9507 TaxID=3082544 RepID=UPI0039B39C84